MTPDERRAAIVAATTPLVLRHGAGVTTRQIAEAARVAEGTIFRVFPDKDSVLRAVVADALDPDLTLRDLAEIDRGLPFRDRLTAVVRVVQHRVSESSACSARWAGPARSRTAKVPRKDAKALRRSSGAGCRPTARRSTRRSTGPWRT
ncbi:hypothetical protein BJF78_06130 [Pseudonocardia sp. CNS-139]|nr:hypothetical protein BJF78_06130 [Pseudonocardia sp. CNS-139]